ncbi:MAG: acyl-CoA thioesterase [Bacteroidaceae bacterium]|nr:acyl-CoA thioesterase [Bacteroidaceae bacterium]
MIENVTFKHSMPAQIRFSDVDQFGHVNNSVYFSLYDLAKTTYIKEVLSGRMKWNEVGIVVANISANFMNPIFFMDNVNIETSTIELGNKSFTLLQRAIDPDSGVVKCECRTVMVVYDLKEQTPMSMPEDYKQAICDYEGRTLEELSKKSH